jgi:hypothetical protein
LVVEASIVPPNFRILPDDVPTNKESVLNPKWQLTGATEIPRPGATHELF